LNDRLDVSVEALDRGASRLVVSQSVLCAAMLLARARITLACVESRHWRPTRIPAPLARLITPTSQRSPDERRALRA
jgi:acyl-CoA thioesterase FadM